MKLVIIESPFSGEISRNIEYARQCVKDSLSRGEAPICSHLLFTQPGILNDTIPSERNLGMEAGWAWLCVCSYVVVYTDYGISSGMVAGIYRAQQLNIPIIFRTIL